MEVFEQVFILFVFIAVGYVISAVGAVNAQHSQLLSKVLVYVFLPCMTLHSFWTNFNLTYISQNWQFLAVSVLLLAVVAVSAYFVAKLFSGNKYERSVFEYSLTVPNFGYAGYALAEALLGSAGLMQMMVFGMPVTIYMYLYGMARLTKQKMNLKSLLKPAVIALFAGMLLGIFAVPQPAVVADILGRGKACVGPLSMILTGIVISQYSLRDITMDRRLYLVSLLRLVVIPLIVGGVLLCFVQRQVVCIAVLFYSLSCGLNTVVFPKMVNEDCRLGAGLALVSNVLMCLTIPLVFWIFGF